jgi:hypothetical protein
MTKVVVHFAPPSTRTPYLRQVPPNNHAYGHRKDVRPASDAYYPSTIRTAHQRHVRPINDTSPRHITSLTDHITTAQFRHLRVREGATTALTRAPTPMSLTTRTPHAAMSNDTRSPTSEPNDMDKELNARMSNDTRSRTASNNTKV